MDPNVALACSTFLISVAAALLVFYQMGTAGYFRPVVNVNPQAAAPAQVVLHQHADYVGVTRQRPASRR